MNKVTTLGFVFVIIGALAGCQQRTAERPVSESLDPMLQNNEITITQESLAAAVPAETTMDQTSVGDGMAVQEGMDLPPMDSFESTARNIQQALVNVGLYQGKIDGDIGPQTKKAIKAFQAQNNLKVDGKVGPKTWQKLSPYLSQQQSQTAGGAATTPEAQVAIQDFSN